MRLPRRLFTGTALLLVMTQVGCTARGVPVPLVQPAAAMNEADRTACEDYARQKIVAEKVKDARERKAARQARYDTALQECWKPITLAQTLGPEHPEVAEAEPPYQRALTWGAW